jgi:hypothetical protein
VDVSTGAICVNTLKKDWTSDTSLSHVLAVIRCLLIVPFPESSLNDEAGKLFMESYDEYSKRARLMADIHGRSLSVAKAVEDPVQNTKSSSSLSSSSSTGISGCKSAEERGVLQSSSDNSSIRPGGLEKRSSTTPATTGKKLSKMKSLKRL